MTVELVVMDKRHGRAANGLHLELIRIEANDAAHPLRETTIGADGRPERSLFGPGDVRRGEYEIRLRLGDYFAAQGIEEPAPRFLETACLRFGVSGGDVGISVEISPTGYAVSRA